MELLMMSGMPLETCWACNKRWNNKFYYKVASCWLFLLIHIAMQGSMNIKKNRFRLSAKRTSPFKSARVSVQSTTGSRAVRISGSNAGYIKFRGSAKGTGYPLHPVSPTLPLPCVIVCHHISTGLYHHTINIIILLCEILRHNVALLQNVCN